MKTLILGLGNPILTDDAVGLVVARQVHRLLLDRGEAVDHAEASATSLDLLALVEGYERVVIVDALIVPDPVAGRLHRIDLADLPATPTSTSLHGLGPAAAFGLARSLGLAVPDHVAIYGIQVIDPYSFGSELTPALAAAIAEVPAAIVSAEFPDPDSSQPDML